MSTGPTPRELPRLEDATREDLELAVSTLGEVAMYGGFLRAALAAIYAERERIAALAEYERATYRPVDTVPGVYDGRPFKPGPDPLGDPFADLIRTGRAPVAACQCQDEGCRYCKPVSR